MQDLYTKDCKSLLRENQKDKIKKRQSMFMDWKTQYC